MSPPRLRPPSPAAAPAAAAPAAPADASAAPAENAEGLKVGGSANGKLTPIVMFEQADLVVKLVMLGLLACSVLSWMLLIIKMFEFSALKKGSDNFLESFRGAKSITDMGKIAESEEFAGNPMADMAASAAAEVELSRQAGLHVSGEHRDSTIGRAATAIGAVQSSLARRLSGGMQFLASGRLQRPLHRSVRHRLRDHEFVHRHRQHQHHQLGGRPPRVSPRALLATGIGLFTAIPAVVFYNYFQTQITAYGARSEGFVAELINAISRQLDKGA